MKKQVLGLVALAAITLGPVAAQQPYWYPEQNQPYRYQQPYRNNYYINNQNPYVNQRLQLSVNSPVNGSSFRGNFTLAGTGTPGAQVIVTGQMSGSTVVQNNGHWRMPMSLGGLARGTTVHLNVFARDQFGNESNHTQLKYAVAW